MNTNGDILWSAPLPDRLTSSIRYCNDGGYILTGSIDGHPYLYKTNDQGIVSVKNTGIPSEYIHTYPNPSNGLITFEVPGMLTGKIAIRDIRGKLITYVNVSNGHGSLNTLPLSAGIYIYNTETGVSGKLVVTGAI